MRKQQQQINGDTHTNSKKAPRGNGTPRRDGRVGRVADNGVPTAMATDSKAISSTLGGFFSANDLQSQPTRYLWEPWVPRMGLTLVAGLPEMGKTTFLAALIADVAGGPRMGGGRKRRVGNALLLAGEEDYGSMTRPRLIEAGADLDRVRLFGPSYQGEKVHPLLLPADMDRLETYIREEGILLVAFDPISRYAQQGLDFNNELQTREVLDALQNLSFQCSCSVVITRNLNKNKNGSLLDKINGSAAFRDVPRSILFLVDNPLNPAHKALMQEKCSVAEKAKSVAFELPRTNGVPRFQMLGKVELTGQDVADSFMSAGERAEWKSAHEFLRRVIGNDWIDANMLEKGAADEGIGKQKLWRAKSELKLQKRRVGFGPGSRVQWGRPKEDWPLDLTGEI